MRRQRAAHYLLLIIFATGPGMINFCNKFSVNIFTVDDGFLSAMIVYCNPCSRSTADIIWAGVHSSSAPRDSKAAAEAGRI